MGMDLKTQAAIGIGVPLGVILMFVLAGFVYVNMKKKQGGEVVDLDAIKTDPYAPAPKVIKWNPNTYNA